MGLPKGMTNNLNGRPKGVPNKNTTDLRQWLKDFVEGQKEQIAMDWETLEPKERIVMFEKLLRFVLPTLQATSLQTDFEKLTEGQLDLIIEQLKKEAIA